MQGSNLENITPVVNGTNNLSDAPTIIKTDVGAKDGQNKCPKCGSTDIAVNANTGKLRCNFCRHEFEPQKVSGLEEDISKLEGQIIGSGATNIVADTNEVLTFKCSSCGAEVVIDTSSSTQARCHWCRNTLSVNQQIPNGTIPDVVLPFNITKEVAKEQINKFVGKRKFFAHPKFKKEFTTENIMGVYFPYMVVDVNSHVSLVGQGEHLTKKYKINDKFYYDADVYDVEREFDLTIHGLTIESNSDRLNNNSKDKTNNIINSIMPFDIENCAKYNADYLKGYTSEKRDTNIEELKGLVDIQTKDVARFSANDTLQEYDRGVAWSSEQVQVKGQQWKAAYLPVWLYSYQEVKGNKKVLHYVAVNARTKETMGSVPIHMPMLFGISAIIEFLSIFLWWVMLIDTDYGFLIMASGFLFFTIMFTKYRNSNARHEYETDTKTQKQNLRKVDNYVTHRKKLSNSEIQGANNTNVRGKSIGSKMLDSVLEQNPLANVIKDINKDVNKK